MSQGLESACSAVNKRQLTLLLVAHALNVSSDRFTYTEDGEFLGHWQDEKWIERLRKLARELADIEKERCLKAASEFVNSDLGQEW